MCPQGLSDLKFSDDTLHNSPAQSDLIASAPYVYTVEVDVTSLFVGGSLRIDFWNYQQTSNTQIASFSAAFGGLALGAGNTWGTAWFNYDVNTIVNSQWSARMQANFAGVGVNVNLWGLQGKVIGQLAAGGLAAIMGTVGGQGSFYH